MMINYISHIAINENYALERLGSLLAGGAETINEFSSETGLWIATAATILSVSIICLLNSVCRRRLPVRQRIAELRVEIPPDPWGDEITPSAFAIHEAPRKKKKESPEVIHHPRQKVFTFVPLKDKESSEVSRDLRPKGFRFVPWNG